MSTKMTLFDWANDINAYLAPRSPATSNTTSRPPCDLATICSGTQNPWGSLSHDHNHHHCPQPPCGLPVPSYTMRHPWTNSCHRHHHIRPSQPPPPHFDLPPQPASVQIVEMVCHPQGIAPMKPVIHTMSPVHHNMPPTPVQLVEASHHP